MKKRAKWASLSIPTKLGMDEKLEEGSKSATMMRQAEAMVNL